MGYIRRVDRSATVGFCPTAPYLSAGSAASTIDMNFSASSVLEVFKVDLASPQSELPSAGSPATASERFNRVSWGNTGVGTSLYPLGLVAGGLEDGTVHLWDPNKIIQGGDSARSTVTKLKKHKSAVRALEFNSTTTHILASGSTEAEILLWDLTRASIPTFMPVLKDPSAGMGVEADMTFISWNQKVQHILASCTTSGRTVVWDIRRQKPIANLLDLNSQRRCSVLQWNPEVATQVIVASDDDRSPTMQLWDLRNSVSPLKEFVGHAKGVKGMSWCPHDPYLLLSCATDGRTFCWDVTKAEVIGEMPSTGNWHLDVQWSPVTPGLFSITSFDGTVGISSLQSFLGPPTEEQYAQYGDQAPPGPLKRAPAWLKRPVGVSFGFGGKLVSFTHKPGQSQDPQTGQMVQIDKADITIQQVAMQSETIPKSEEFSQAIQTGNREDVLSFCNDKSTKIKGDDGETWKFLSMMFSQDAKRELINHLGFEDVLPKDTPQEVAQETERVPADLPPVKTVPADNGVGFFDNDHSDFFDNFGDGEPDTAGAADPSSSTTPAGKDKEQKKDVAPAKKQPSVVAGEKEDGIQRALMVRNYEAAVEACFAANRSADALLIAQVGGAELYSKASKRYMSQQPRPFMGLLSAVADNDFHTLINERLVSQWRETLAMLVAYVNDTDAWVSLCNELGMRLAQARKDHAATLCFICAGNVDRAVALWIRTKKASTIAMMQDVMEKGIVLEMATQAQSASDGLCDLVHNYASILAAQGSMDQALQYLDMIPGEASESVHLLRDRIMGTANQSATSQPTGQGSTMHGMDAQGYGYGQPMPHNPMDHYGTGSYHQAPAPVASPMHTPPVMDPSTQGYHQDSSYNYGYNPPYNPSNLGYHQSGQPSAHHGQHGTFMQPNQVPASPKPFTPTHPPAPEPQPRPNMFMPVQGPGTGAAVGGMAGMAGMAGMTGMPGMPGMPGAGGMGGHVTQQPASPAKPVSPPAPQGPPAHISVATAVTSKVPANQKVIVSSFTNLFRQCEAAMPAKKREMADTSKKLGTLFWMLNEGTVPAEIVQQLLTLGRAFESGDVAQASQIHAQLTQNAWTDATSFWLTALKRLLKVRQMIR